jgi:integrase
MKTRNRTATRHSREVALFLKHARAENTVRAYAADLRHFVSTGGRIPSSPMRIAEYLAALGKTHRYSSIARRSAALSAAHRERGYADPCRTDVVRAVLKGLRRKLGVGTRQMRPLLWEQLLQVAELQDRTPRSLQIRALLLLGFGAALRRSELVALDVEDLGWSGDDLVVQIRQSKGDPEGRGQHLTIPSARRAPLGKALLDWLRASGIRRGPIFRRFAGAALLAKRMTPQTVTRLVKGGVRRAGIDDSDYGAHSLRAGFVTSAALGGVPLWRIKQFTRHSRETMVETYVRTDRQERHFRMPWQTATLRAVEKKGSPAVGA